MRADIYTPVALIHVKKNALLESIISKRATSHSERWQVPARLGRQALGATLETVRVRCPDQGGKKNGLDRERGIGDAAAARSVLDLDKGARLC